MIRSLGGLWLCLAILGAMSCAENLNLWGLLITALGAVLTVMSGAFGEGEKHAEK